MIVVPFIFSCLNNDIVMKFHNKWNNILLGLYLKHNILKSIDVIIILIIKLNSRLSLIWIIENNIPETIIPIFLLEKLFGIKFLNNDSSTTLAANDSTIVQFCWW